jgi:uncharacterized membrane protein YdcZ (DUF606 family)
MENISAAWLYPVIVIAGALQAWGPPMNNALKIALVNPWLASLVSFLPIVAGVGYLLHAAITLARMKTPAPDLPAESQQG